MDGDESYSVNTIILKMTELLNDESIFKNLKKALFPQILSDKIDNLTAQVHQLMDRVAKKEARICELEKRVTNLETQADDVE